VSNARLRLTALMLAGTLVALIVAGAVVGSRNAATTLADRAQHALADAGLDGVAVHFAGREATLRGGSRADLAESKALIEQIDGVRSARIDAADHNAGPGNDPTSHAYVRLAWVDGRLRLAGVVPTAKAAAEIKSAASLAFGHSVGGDVRVDVRAAAPSWMGDLARVIHDLAAVRNIAIEVRPDATFHMSGLIESADGRALLRQRVKQTLDGAEVTDRLRVDDRGLSAEQASTINTASVQFEPASTIVTYQAAEQLNRIADVLQQVPSLRLTALGNAESRDHVNAVRDYLIAVGISANRITAQASGVGADGRVDFMVTRKNAAQGKE
jgi:hypothetical protein